MFFKHKFYNSMKLLKSTIWAMMAVAAVSFTACEDDDNYVAGQPSAGAYFASDLPAEYEIAPPAEANLIIPVSRGEANGPATTAISWKVDPESDAFTFPGSVSFEGSSTTANALISVDPAKLAQDQIYTITASIADANNYANGVYQFDYFYGSKMIVEETTGKLVLSVYYNGYQDGMPVTISYRENNPNKQTVLVEDLYPADASFTIQIPDMSFVGPNGGIPVHVVPTASGTVNADYGDVWITDYYTYRNEIAPKAGENPDVDDSYYDPATKTFYIDMIWYVPGVGSFGNGLETLTLAGGSGPADYSLEVEYIGLFTDPGNVTSAIGSFTSAADVAKVMAAMVPTSDGQTALNHVLAGGEGVKEVALGENVREMFDISEAGEYILMAVSYSADGEPQMYAYDEATINLGGNPDADWNYVGTTTFYDPWVFPAYTTQDNQPISNVDYPIEAEMMESKTTKGLYRLNDPYHQESFLLVGNNTGKKANWTVQVYEDGFVSVPQQYSGFANASWGNLTIANYDGFVKEANPDVSNAAIQEFIKSKGEEPSYVEDGMITIPVALFGCELMNDGNFGYSWKNPQVGYIALPEASQAAKRKARAAMVAAPKYRALAPTAVRAIVSSGNGFRVNPVILSADRNLKAKGIHFNH